MKLKAIGILASLFATSASAQQYGPPDPAWLVAWKSQVEDICDNQTEEPVNSCLAFGYQDIINTIEENNIHDFYINMAEVCAAVPECNFQEQIYDFLNYMDDFIEELEQLIAELQ